VRRERALIDLRQARHFDRLADAADPARVKHDDAGRVAGEFASAAGSYAVRNGTVAGGGQVAEAGPFKLISTIGEGAMGTTSAGQYRLTSGFPATIGNTQQGGPDGGRIFYDGFED